MGRVKLFLPYILAVVCSTAFFAFELVPDKSKEYVEAKQKHDESKQARTIALEKLKDYGKGTQEYNLYEKEKKTTDKAWQELLKVKEKDKVFGFTNLQQFLGEFGWVFGLFIYSLFNLFRTYLSSNKEYGSIILHSTIISTTIFYFYWIFQPFQDFNKGSYYLVSVITGIMISYSTFLMSKYKFTEIGKLQIIIRNLFDFILIDTKEKELIKDEKKEYYNQKSLELVKDVLDNE